MKIWIGNEKKEMSYDEICHKLGISPDVHFVHVTTAGTIGFTVGKPDEIRYLHRMCAENGFRASKDLKQTVKNL